MSVSVGLFIKIVSSDYSPMKILDLLCKGGWSFNDHGLKGYLPINDNENFDWNFNTISDEELISILHQKNSLKELLGIVLTWKDSNVGGEFLLDYEGSITISLSINRQIFLDNITDVNWYLGKIIPLIKANDFKIKSIKFEENI